MDAVVVTTMFLSIAACAVQPQLGVYIMLWMYFVWHHRLISGRHASALFAATMPRYFQLPKRVLEQAEQQVCQCPLCFASMYAQELRA